jgi:hypothetical protein
MRFALVIALPKHPNAPPKHPDAPPKHPEVRPEHPIAHPKHLVGKMAIMSTLIIPSLTTITRTIERPGKS